MLNKEEQRFVYYWSEQRKRKKQFLLKLSIGLPLGVMMALGLIISMLSGWYRRAEMALRSSGSLLLVILIATIGIVVFITVFAARHKWDQNEQHYQELIVKEKNENAA